MFYRTISCLVIAISAVLFDGLSVYGQGPVIIPIPGPPPIRPLPPLPWPPPPPVFQPAPIRPVLQVPTDWIIPPHVGGDADFKGHGPNLKLYVKLYIKPAAPNEVWAEVWFDAMETKRDWTQASNWGAPHHVFVALFTRPLICIETPVDFGPDPYELDPYPQVRGRKVFRDVDTSDKGPHTRNNPFACGLLNRVHFTGDTVGREAGTRTGVKLEFNPILAR